MKYYATKFSISNLIFFLVISFFGVSASAYQKCEERQIYTTGGCGSVNMCSSGKVETYKVCYEVPDQGAGPIPGSPGPGAEGTGGRGGLEEQARKDTEAKKKEQQEKYCKSQPAVIELGKQKCTYDAINFTNTQANSCSNLSWSAAFYLGVNYQSSCRSYWAGQQLQDVQRCNVSAAEAVVALGKECP